MRAEMDDVCLTILTLLILQTNVRTSIADLVSYGKTCNANSYVSSRPPQNALDDNDVPYLAQGGCFLSEPRVNHWWKVDLEKEFEIVNVAIITAIDDPPVQYGLLNAKVLVGNNDTIHASGVVSSDNTQCGGNFTYEQLNNSALVDVTCWPPIRGMFVFITSIPYGKIALCEVLVYSSNEEAAQDDLPLNPNGFWPLNTLYTIHDLSGFRYQDASVTTVHFSNSSTTGVAFGDLSPDGGTGSSIKIPNRGRFGNGASFTLVFDIKPGPNSSGEILRAGYFTIVQKNSGTAVYASEIEITISVNSVNLHAVVFNSDTWTSLAVAYNESSMLLWRNGYFVRAEEFDPLAIDMSWNNLKIGFNNGPSGSIRNIHLYNRTLTQKEITAAHTIPSEDKISLRIAGSLISNLYSPGSNLFRYVTSAMFASEHLTETVTVRTVHDCTLRCFRELLCNGYAYMKESKRCVIGMEFVDKNDLVVNQDWYFYMYLPSW